MTKANIREREAYSKLAEDYRPKRPIIRNLIVAFAVGGSICVVGQFFLNYLVAKKLPLTQAQGMTSSMMVFLGAFLTGMGVYDKLGRLAGMGAALPITGFANSIVSPAMEFKREGFVLGVAAKMFQVAGPVIVYASITSVLVTVIRQLLFK